MRTVEAREEVVHIALEVVEQAVDVEHIVRAHRRAVGRRIGVRLLDAHELPAIKGGGVAVDLDGHDGYGLRAAVFARQIDEEELFTLGDETDVSLAVGLSTGGTAEGRQLARQPALSVHGSSLSALSCDDVAGVLHSGDVPQMGCEQAPCRLPSRGIPGPPKHQRRNHCLWAQAASERSASRQQQHCR